MRKLPIITAASLGLFAFAGSAAWACDWDDGGGYRQSRVYRYSYAPRTYGYYAPVYGYRSAYWDDDDYDYGYGYGGVAVGVDVVRNRRFHRRYERTAANVGERGGRIREGTVRASAAREGSALRGAGSGEGGRAAVGATAGMGRGLSRGSEGGGRR
jgi:hypothetical protein